MKPTGKLETSNILGSWKPITSLEESFYWSAVCSINQCNEYACVSIIVLSLVVFTNMYSLLYYVFTVVLCHILSYDILYDIFPLCGIIYTCYVWCLTRPIGACRRRRLGHEPLHSEARLGGGVWAALGQARKQAARGASRGPRISIDIDWLVVWNMTFIFLYLGNNHPNWRTHIFQRIWNHQPVDRWR